jgi:general secretion pathway protein G
MSKTNRTSFAARRSRAFTLVEILIVIIILGILATIVIPQFTSASHQAKENSLRDDLRFMRSQVGLFKAEHRDVPPGYPGGDRTVAPTATDFEDQMTLSTDGYCATNPVRTPVFKYGPYLSRMPANPINNLTTVIVVANGAALPPPDDTTGWIYKPQTQEFMANLTGSDANGTPYASY